MQVICWELLTERHFYSVMMAPSDVIDALNGDKQLPSELPMDEAVDSYAYACQSMYFALFNGRTLSSDLLCNWVCLSQYHNEKN